MHEIIFYRDKNGKSSVLEYISELEKRADKDSRINYTKIQEYIQTLSEHGMLSGEPHIKHVEGKLWELRPIRNRIFFAAWVGGSFVLLHHFIKKTQKTPRQEIDAAKRKFDEYRREHGDER